MSSPRAMDGSLPAAPSRLAKARDVDLLQLASRADWLMSREEVLVHERATARPRDAIRAQRHRLPMFTLDRNYRFEGGGAVFGLRELFDGLPRLLVCHFMLGTGAEGACPSCHAAADAISEQLLDHLRGRDVAFALVSRAPLSRIERYRARRGWDLPWFSSLDGDFYRDFLTARTDASPAETCGRRSAVDSVAGRIFHSYAMFARRTETLGNWCYWLDLTPPRG